MAKIAKTAWWTGWVNLVLAALLAVSPWVLGFNADKAALMTALITAIVIGALAMAESVTGLVDEFIAEFDEWANLALGLWTIAAPWIVGFAQHVAAAWIHVVVGVLVTALSAWALCQVRRFRQFVHATA